MNDQAIIALLSDINASATDRYSIDCTKRLANLKHMYAKVGYEPRGKRVLDIGCGSGLACLMSALLGAEQCTGIEIDQEGLRKANEQTTALRDIGHDLPVQFLEHDVRTGLPFEDASVDFILMEEAVSHIVDLDNVLRECVRVLAPGGKIAISDSNNPFSPAKRRELVKEWLAFEKGPRPGAEKFPPHERSYETMRAHRIHGWYPDMPDDQVLALAENTSGLWGEDLQEACEEHIQTGQLPAHRYQVGQCPVHPDGIYLERLLDPYELCTQLAAYGCRSAHAIPHWASSSALKRVADSVLRFCLPGRIGMRLARGYLVVGQK